MILSKAQQFSSYFFVLEKEFYMVVGVFYRQYCLCSVEEVNTYDTIIKIMTSFCRFYYSGVSLKEVYEVYL